MKNVFRRCVAIAILMLTQNLGAGGVSPFLPSSDKLFTRNEASALKDIHSFVFLFSLRMEKEEASSIVEFFNQELGKIGQVVKKEVFTDRGIDVECFSLSRLQLSLAQLANSETQLFSTLKVELAVNNIVGIGKNKALVPVNTNSWTLYLNRENETILNALKKSVPSLLKSFLNEFVKANGTEKKPTFFITYDTSWWKAAL